MRQPFNAQHITINAETDYDALGRRGQVGVSTERFARMHVGDVHFDHRALRAFDGVVQRDGRVGVSAGVEDDAQQVAGLRRRANTMNNFNQFTFIIKLPTFDNNT